MIPLRSAASKAVASGLTAMSMASMATSTRPRVFVTRAEEEIPAEAIKRLREKCEVSFSSSSGPISRSQLLDRIGDVDGLFCLLTDKIDQEVIQRASKLKVIGTMSVGFDHVDLKAAADRNIKVGYTPGVLTESTAELTVALLLATSRRLFEAAHHLRSGGWGSWDPLWMCGPTLEGATVGIVGLGRIGQAVQRRLEPFGVRKFVYAARTGAKHKDIERGAEHVPFRQLLSESDFVVATCALTPDTTNMFDAASFAAMKEGAVFVNTSRGGLVDQQALFTALSDPSAPLAAAGLDVMTPEPLPTDHPLLGLDNCVLLPHIGSATVATRTTMATLTANNIIAALDGTPMPEELKCK